MTIDKQKFMNSILGGDPAGFSAFADGVLALEESETGHVAALVDVSSVTFNTDMVSALQDAGLMASS